MKILLRFVVAMAVVVFGSTNSFAIGIEVAVGGWAQSPEGQLAYKSSLAADSVDFENEARYADEDRLFGRINLDLPVLPNIYFMGTPMEFDGDGSKNFTFGDATVTGDFYSKAKLDHYDLALYYGIPLTGLASLGTLGIDLGINVRRMDIEMVVQDKSTPLAGTDSVKETIYIPMGFLAVQVMPTENLALEAELRGISYDANHYFDLIGRLKYRFAGVAFAAAGWRHEDLSIDEKDIKADVTISGPFIEGGLQF
jgi:outer membrane protein